MGKDTIKICGKRALFRVEKVKVWREFTGEISCESFKKTRDGGKSQNFGLTATGNAHNPYLFP